MADHNVLACVAWFDAATLATPFHPPAYCTHSGCPWESHATTDTVQIEAYITHHQRRHGEGS